MWIFLHQELRGEGFIYFYLCIGSAGYMLGSAGYMVGWLAHVGGCFMYLGLGLDKNMKIFMNSYLYTTSSF